MYNISNSSAVIVLGMHRSGTSTIAKALELFGIHIGTNLLPGGTPNPKGFYEDQAILQFNKDLLSTLNSRWDYIQADPISTISDTIRSDLYKRALEIIEESFGGHDIWGFKEPRTLRLLPFWTDFFEKQQIKAKYIVVTRNPDDIAESLFIRNLLPHSHSYLLTAIYYRDLLAHMRTHQFAVIDYDFLLGEPKSEIRRLEAQLELPPAADGDLTFFCENFVSRELKRSQGTADHVTPIRDTLVEAHKQVTLCCSNPSYIHSSAITDCWKKLEAHTKTLLPNWYDPAIISTAEQAVHYRKELKRLESGVQALHERTAQLKQDVAKRDKVLLMRKKKIKELEEAIIIQRERNAHLKNEIVKRDDLLRPRKSEI